MNEIIKVDYIEIVGAIDHIKFVAQKYFNNHGMGWKHVISAEVVEGGISCEWEGTPPPEPKVQIEQAPKRRGREPKPK